MNTEFYEKELVDNSYDFVVTKTVDLLQEESDVIASNFTNQEIENYVRESFTLGVYSQIISQVEEIILNVNKGIIEDVKISFVPLRNSLLTASNQIAYDIYQDLPSCNVSDELTLDDYPRCVPPGIDYDVVIAPLISDFEVAIYDTIPNEIGGLEDTLPLKLLSEVNFYRDILLLSLLVILILIAFILYKPFSLILKYQSFAFALAAIIGLALSFFVKSIAEFILGDSLFRRMDSATLEFSEYLMGLVSFQIQRISLLFLIVGIALLLVSIVLKRSLNERQT
ncbi:hypothetical protein GF376_01940 [Candidatus Peregrinibacteria bacterium]|nr:hypothetical protein [Candidatus Peregrinibacteria bacterium]